MSLGGKKKHKWEYIHDEAGFNYRMPAINASIGIAQLKKLNKLIKYSEISIVSILEILKI